MNNAKLTSALEVLIVKSRNNCITCLAKKYGFNPEEAISFLDKKVVYVQEPVDEWSKIKDKKGETILEKFYANQHKYAFSLTF